MSMSSSLLVERRVAIAVRSARWCSFPKFVGHFANTIWMYPVLAAGGIATGEQMAAAMAMGAEGATIGVAVFG